MLQLEVASLNARIQNSKLMYLEEAIVNASIEVIETGGDFIYFLDLDGKPAGSVSFNSSTRFLELSDSKLFDLFRFVL